MHVHYVEKIEQAGITWIGLLYFFNIVNVQVMAKLDGPTKAKVVPPLMSRALWFFRWSALLTVLAGIYYWVMIILAGEPPGAEGSLMMKTTGLWLVIVAVFWVLNMVAAKQPATMKNGWVFAAINTVLILVMSYLMLHFLQYEGDTEEGDSREDVSHHQACHETKEGDRFDGYVDDDVPESKLSQANAKVSGVCRRKRVGRPQKSRHYNKSYRQDSQCFHGSNCPEDIDQEVVSRSLRRFHQALQKYPVENRGGDESSVEDVQKTKEVFGFGSLRWLVHRKQILQELFEAGEEILSGAFEAADGEPE